MAYLLLLIRTSICIDVFTGCMPPKTAWDRVQRRSEGDLNFIRQSRGFKQWKRTKRSIQAHGYTTFHTFRKGRQKKWRENRENLVSNLESRWPVLVEGRALNFGHSECCCSDAVATVGCSSFLCKSFRNTFKVNFVSKVTSRKNQIS